MLLLVIEEEGVMGEGFVEWDRPQVDKFWGVKDR